jgi:hypothetical protein
MTYTVRIRGAVGSAKQREYVCFEALIADPPPDAIPCPECEWPADRLVSAPPVHTQFAISVSRGPSVKPPPSSPDYMALGEGKSRKEFREERRKFWRDHDYKRRRGALE